MLEEKRRHVKKILRRKVKDKQKKVVEKAKRAGT